MHTSGRYLYNQTSFLQNGKYTITIQATACIVKAISFVLCISFSSCVSSTKFSYATGGCQEAFKADEKLLMAEIEGISAYQSSLFYQQLVDKINAAGIQLVYAADEDMNLRLHQVTAKPDSINLHTMHQLHLNYYLKIKLLDSKSGEVYGTYSKETVDARQLYSSPAEEPDYTRAALQISLYSTDAKRLIYNLTVTTEMRPVTMSKKNGGQRYYNISNARQAIQKALNKGIKRMLKDCHCCI